MGGSRLCTVGYFRKYKDAPDELLQLLQDNNAYIATEAAYAVAYLGEKEKGIKRLLHPNKEGERKMGYSLLECLSLDTDMKQSILKYSEELKNAAKTLPMKENEDCGFMANGILVNLGLLNIDEMHGLNTYEEGLKLNKGRRAMKPLP